MSNVKGLIAAAVATLVVSAGVAHADAAAAVKARQAHMDLYAFNLGILGSMAKGETDYDADAASAAASNIEALAKMKTGAFWPQGSAAGEIENSRALPEIWTTYPAVAEKAQDLVAASEAMSVAAGTGLEPLQAAMGPLGGACVACHKAFRQPE